MDGSASVDDNQSTAIDTSSDAFDARKANWKVEVIPSIFASVAPLLPETDTQLQDTITAFRSPEDWISGFRDGLPSGISAYQARGIVEKGLTEAYEAHPSDRPTIERARAALDVRLPAYEREARLWTPTSADRAATESFKAVCSRVSSDLPIIEGASQDRARFSNSNDPDGLFELTASQWAKGRSSSVARIPELRAILSERIKDNITTHASLGSTGKSVSVLWEEDCRCEDERMEANRLAWGLTDQDTSRESHVVRAMCVQYAVLSSLSDQRARFRHASRL